MDEPEVDEMSVRQRADGALEMTATVDGEGVHFISRDDGGSWDPLPSHSVMLRHLADVLEPMEAGDVLRAEVAHGKMRVHLDFNAFRRRFGVASKRSRGDSLHYSATEGGIDWVTSRLINNEERTAIARALKAVH